MRILDSCAPKPTSKDARLFVSISPVVSSDVYVKKAQDAKIVALNFTASGGDVHLQNADLAGYVSISNGPWTSVDFGSRVTSTGLFDEAGRHLGFLRAPDTFGVVRISDMKLTIPKGESKTLFARAMLSSSASVKEPYDRIAVNLWNDGALDAFDKSGERVTIERSSDLLWDIRSEAPPIFQTIRPFGELTITEHGHPVSQIVIGGKDYWYPMAQYKATAKYEAIYIDFANVALVWWPDVKANPADFKMIAVASGGVLRGQSAMSSIGLVDVGMFSDPIFVPKGGEVLFQLWAKFSSVMASSTVGGTTEGVARSGHAPALGLNNDCTKGVCAEWDEYGGRLNVRSTGRTSGERIYVAGAVKHGNPMVLRKSQPIVTVLPLASYTLANIDKDLFKFQVAADSAGSIGWKQFTFAITKSLGVSIANLRLRRGSTDIDPETYAITDLWDAWSGADVISGKLSDVKTSNVIVIAFKSGYEETISGSGAVYTIHASVAGVVPGSSIVVMTYSATPLALSLTGFLQKVSPGSPNLYVIGDVGWTAGGLFLWSDMSEVPHSAALGTFGGSRDWTDQQFVHGLIGSVTLSL